MHGGLLALRLLARKYEFRDEEERAPLDGVITTSFPLLLHIFRQLLAAPPSPQVGGGSGRRQAALGGSRKGVEGERRASPSMQDGEREEGVGKSDAGEMFCGGWTGEWRDAMEALMRDVTDSGRWGGPGRPGQGVDGGGRGAAGALVRRRSRGAVRDRGCAIAAAVAAVEPRKWAP